MIDSHNHVRQGILALEENWQSQCPWFRLFTFFVGVNLTDMWKAAKQGLPANHFLSQISSKRFAEFVGMKMLTNRLSTNNFGGKPLMQKKLEIPSIPTSISTESSIVSAISSVSPMSLATTIDTPTSISSNSVGKTGFISDFPREEVSDLVGTIVNGHQVTHHIKGHIIVKTKKDERCHVCVARKGTNNASRSRFYCKTCKKPVCVSSKLKPNAKCLEVHGLCMSDKLTAKGWKIPRDETCRVINEWQINGGVFPVEDDNMTTSNSTGEVTMESV